ncbi:DUF4123 domain-containing protein, partial [Desulfovibrio sp. OttesenSCG-928-O18]|nr:DUF4123 domain-containing protein [Desulfovibrio sp. OttesenSCG-928-O18]
EKLTAAAASARKKTEQGRIRAFENFSELVSDIESLSGHLRDKAEKTTAEERRKALYRLADSKMDAADYARLKLFYQLEEAKQQEDLFARAIAIHRLLETDRQGRYGMERHLPTLAKLADRPDDLQLAADLIRDEDMGKDQIRDLLEKLMTAPEAGRAAIKDRDKTKALRYRYAFATQEEGSEDTIRLPLAAVLPEALQAVEKPGVISLGKGGSKNPAKGLTLTRQERMLPPGFAPGRPGKASVLPFLRTGERLYMVREKGEGVPIFAGTPLDALSPFGPSLVEYTGKTAEGFLNSLERSTSRSDWERPYFIAAACGPEDLAAHLAWLSVMRSKREKSLYGSFEDFIWSKTDSRSRLTKHLAPIPQDIPGETIRLTAIEDPDLFLALAKHADDKGLARLLGPIRGIWTQDRQGQEKPWAELRFAPSGREEPRPGVLGSSPLLALNDNALHEIVAAKDAFMTHLWAGYLLREECWNDEAKCAVLRPEATLRVEKIFADLSAKGFVSPWDKGTILYFTEYAVKDPDTLAIIRAIVDDTKQSSAKRARAVRAAGKSK